MNDYINKGSEYGSLLHSSLSVSSAPFLRPLLKIWNPLRAPYFTSPPLRLNGNHVCSAVMTGWLGSAASGIQIMNITFGAQCF